MKFIYRVLKHDLFHLFKVVKSSLVLILASGSPRDSKQLSPYAR